MWGQQMWAVEGVDVATWPPPRPIWLLFSIETITEVAMSTIIHSYPCPCCHGRVSVFRFLGLLLTGRQKHFLKCCELLWSTSFLDFIQLEMRDPVAWEFKEPRVGFKRPVMQWSSDIIAVSRTLKLLVNTVNTEAELLLKAPFSAAEVQWRPCQWRL